MAEDMKNIPLEEEEDEGLVMVLEDENGNNVEFEFLDVIEHEGIEYIYLYPTEDMDAGEVVILKITSLDDENESYESIDDEELLQTLFDMFKEKHKEEFDFG